MPISPGARLGSYEVLSPLGAGGMGGQKSWYSEIESIGRIGFDIRIAK